MKMSAEQLKLLLAKNQGIQVKGFSWNPDQLKPIKVRKPKQNKTEQAYDRLLAALKQSGEIYDYHFEAITFKLGIGVRYTPDFMVVYKVEMANSAIRYLIDFHEVKGPYIRDDAGIKFQCARKQFFFFKWKMMQLTGGIWNEIYPD